MKTLLIVIILCLSAIPVYAETCLAWYFPEIPDGWEYGINNHGNRCWHDPGDITFAFSTAEIYLQYYTSEAIISWDEDSVVTFGKGMTEALKKAFQEFLKEVADD